MRKAVKMALATVMIIGWTGTAIGQEGPGPRPGPRDDMEMQGQMIEQLLTNPKVAEKLGLEQAQIDEIRSKMYDLQVKQIKLEADMKLASLKQARALMAQEIDEKEALDIIEELGELRTDLAKLRMQRLLLVKKTLTPEQMEKIKKLRQRARDNRDPAMAGNGPADREEMMRRRQERREQRKNERGPNPEEGADPAEEGAADGEE